MRLNEVQSTNWMHVFLSKFIGSSTILKVNHSAVYQLLLWLHVVSILDCSTSSNFVGD